MVLDRLPYEIRRPERRVGHRARGSYCVPERSFCASSVFFRGRPGSGLVPGRRACALRVDLPRIANWRVPGASRCEIRPEADSEGGIGLLSSRTGAMYSSRPSPASSSGPVGALRVERAQVRGGAERATVMSR